MANSNSAMNVSEPTQDLKAVVKQIGDTEFSLLEKWWEGRDFPKLHRAIFAESGYMIFVEGIPVIAGALYIPRSKSGNIAWLAWITTNPNTKYEYRTVGWKMLVEVAEQLAEMHGIPLLITAANNNNYVRRMEALGFQTYDRDVTHMLKKVGG